MLRIGLSIYFKEGDIITTQRLDELGVCDKSLIAFKEHFNGRAALSMQNLRKGLEAGLENAPQYFVSILCDKILREYSREEYRTWTEEEAVAWHKYGRQGNFDDYMVVYRLFFNTINRLYAEKEI